MTILVVDDNSLICELVARIVGQAGFSVLTANSGFDAISLLQSHNNKIDLVVTDIEMPGMSGLELSTRLIALGLKIPILFISGGPVLGLNECVDIGFVSKPFIIGTLLAELRRLTLKAAVPEPVVA
jgi:CheY-like chemotaxis protein